jgi:SOS-response transcriptional repressor LexA
VELTPRQADVILTIRNYRHLHGQSPTYREIADTLGIARGTAVAHINALIRKKFITHRPGKARSFEVLADTKKSERG